MAARYYTFHGRQELDDERLMDLLKEQDQGVVLCIDDNQEEFQIKFDSQKGEVSVELMTQNERVKIYYSFDGYVKRMTEAIARSAKLELLLALASLGDDRITELVHKKHINAETGKMTAHDALNLEETLAAILEHASPTSLLSFFSPKTRTPLQKAVYDVLTDDACLENINSKETVIIIIERIKNKMDEKDEPSVKIKQSRS